MKLRVSMCPVEAVAMAEKFVNTASYSSPPASAQHAEPIPTVMSPQAVTPEGKQGSEESTSGQGPLPESDVQAAQHTSLVSRAAGSVAGDAATSSAESVSAFLHHPQVQKGLRVIGRLPQSPSGVQLPPEVCNPHLTPITLEGGPGPSQYRIEVAKGKVAVFPQN